MFQYSQHVPPPDLRAWVRLVWMMTVDDGPAGNLPAAADGIELVGIRLQPWALGALARVPASSFTDNWQPTDAVASRLLPHLEDALRYSTDQDSALRMVMQHVREQLRGMKAPATRVITVVGHVARSASSDSQGRGPERTRHAASVRRGSGSHPETICEGSTRAAGSATSARGCARHLGACCAGRGILRSVAFP